MKINNRLCKEFNMKINSFSYQPLQIERESFLVDGTITPILSSPIVKPKQMKLIAEFKDKIDISNFMAEVLKQSKSLIDIDDGYLYHCYFIGSSSPSDEYWNNRYRVELEFLVIQTGMMIQKSLNRLENIVINQGNYRSECMYKMIANQDVSSVTVGNVIIRNVKAHEEIVIDGMLKKVYSQNDRNRYSDCQFQDNSFPYLEPGENIIYKDNEDVEVVLYYYPVYI